jgi:hypothetical protein
LSSAASAKFELGLGIMAPFPWKHGIFIAWLLVIAFAFASFYLLGSSLWMPFVWGLLLTEFTFCILK